MVKASTDKQQSASPHCSVEAISESINSKINKAFRNLQQIQHINATVIDILDYK
jgi:hypothetical protein